MTDTADAPDELRPPRTISYAFAAVIAHVVLALASAALLWGFQDYLRRQLVKSNAKAKKPKANYDLSTPSGFRTVNHDLHSGLTGGLVQTAVFGFLLVLLAVNFRRGRGWARWAAALVLLVVVQSPFRLLSLGGDAPVLIRLGSALVGLASIAVIILLFLPETSRYFTAVRGVTAAERGRDGAPTGLRGLFAPRPRPSVEPSPVPDDVPSRAPERRASRAPERRPAEPAAAPQGQAEKRAKAKARAGVEGTSAAPGRPAQQQQRPAAAKNRGKSRKGS